MTADTNAGFLDPEISTITPVLVVDDVGDNLDLMEAMLLGEGFQEVLLANTGRRALTILEGRDDIGVILMDLMMPEMDGFEMCKRISSNPRTQHIPIIVVTGAAFRENDALVRSFAAGAVDFVSKPLNEVELFARIRVALELYQERRLHQASVKQLAENEGRLKTLIQQMPVGIAHIDGQGRLLMINDRLRALLSLSADESTEGVHLRRFFPDLDTAGVETLLDRAYLDRPQRLQARLLSADGKQLSTLLTITLFSGADAFDSTFIITLEDTADYQSFTDAQGADSRLAEQLHHALQHNEFTLYYQPQFHLKTKQLEAMKALLRWHHPDRGLLRPSAFLTQARALGFDGALRDWVIAQACTQAILWDEEGLPPLRVAVSLPMAEISRPELYQRVREVLQETCLEPSRLTLELVGTPQQPTESDRQALTQLQQLGVRLALDDVGSEPLALRELKYLPLDTLKLAKSMVQGAMEDQEEQAILDSLIGLAHDLGLQVVAEGVESQSAMDYAMARGCDIAQGYFFSKPRPPQHIDEILSTLCRFGFSG